MSTATAEIIDVDLVAYELHTRIRMVEGSRRSRHRVRGSSPPATSCFNCNSGCAPETAHRMVRLRSRSSVNREDI